MRKTRAASVPRLYVKQTRNRRPGVNTHALLVQRQGAAAIGREGSVEESYTSAGTDEQTEARNKRGRSLQCRQRPLLLLVPIQRALLL